MLLTWNEYLFRLPKEEALYGATHIGQASWATGPFTCAECVHFSAETSDSGECEKYEQLMGFEGPAFPDHALSCRFYEVPEPPPEAA